MKNKLDSLFKKYLTNKSWTTWIIKTVITLVVPYLYLLFCGLVLNEWLKLYSWTMFIFISFVALYIIAFSLVIYSTVIMFKKRKK